MSLVLLFYPLQKFLRIYRSFRSILFHLDPCHWAEIEDIFLRDACALMGLAVESPLGKLTHTQKKHTFTNA